MPDPKLSQMSVSMYSTSSGAAARLKLGGVFEAGGDKGAKVLFLEALVRDDYEDAAYEVIDGRIVLQYCVRRAFGIRVALQVTGWSADMSLSFSAVAAKAQVTGQSVQYYVETLGLPDWLERDVVKAVGVAGPLDESSFSKLRTVITKTLPEYLRRTPVESPDLTKHERRPLTFDEYRVPVDEGAYTFSLPRSIHFAMTHLARGDTLKQAKDALREGSLLLNDVGGDIVEEIYLKHAGISPGKTDEVPSPDAVTAARRWLQFQP